MLACGTCIKQSPKSLSFTLFWCSPPYSNWYICPFVHHGDGELGPTPSSLVKVAEIRDRQWENYSVPGSKHIPAPFCVRWRLLATQSNEISMFSSIPNPINIAQHGHYYWHHVFQLWGTSLCSNHSHITSIWDVGFVPFALLGHE